MLVYYAHSQSTYNTEQERDDRLALESLGLQVYCPNNEQDEELFRELGMKHFENLLHEHRFDAIFYRTFRDGVTTWGTGFEVKLAQQYGIPTFEITETVRTYSPEETKAIYNAQGRPDLAVLY